MLGSLNFLNTGSIDDSIHGLNILKDKCMEGEGLTYAGQRSIQSSNF
jgi:hypothetical protein